MSKLEEFLGFGKKSDSNKLKKVTKDWEDALYKLEDVLHKMYRVVPQKDIMDITTVHGSKDTPQRVIDQLGKVTDYLKGLK